MTLSSEVGISIAPLLSVHKHMSLVQPAGLSWADLAEAFRRIDKSGEGVAARRSAYPNPDPYCYLSLHRSD